MIKKFNFLKMLKIKKKKQQQKLKQTRIGQKFLQSYSTQKFFTLSAKTKHQICEANEVKVIKKFITICSNSIKTSSLSTS